MLGHRTLNAEDYFTILKRRWWLLCIPAVIVPVIAVGVTYFLTPKYDSTSLILIDQQKVSSDVVKPLDIGDLQGRLGLITARIESRSTLEPIITKYNLYASQHLPMDLRVDQARKNLVIAPIESQIDRANGLPGFKVTFTADDPRTAQEVCADITGLYTQNNLIDLQNRTVGTTEFVESQLNEEKRKLDDLDKNLADFQAKNMGSLPSDQAGQTNLLSSLGSRLDATTNHLQSLNQAKSFAETMLDQATKSSSGAGLTAKTQSQDELDLEKAEATLSDLQKNYTDAYPDVQTAKRHVADLRAKVARDAAAPPPTVASVPKNDSLDVIKLKAQIRAYDQQIAADNAEQAQINAAMRAAQGRISASPAVFAQYQALTRDQLTEQANYNKLLSAMDQSKMATALQNRQQGEGFSVLDGASLPADPSYPRVSVFAFGGLAGGFALGLLIVALLEYRDTALRTERDVWAFTQLPTLAVIAYSETVSEQHLPAKAGLFKRLFARKEPKGALAG
jgi:polysaccharide chain length determinant protein (PEP-CTERM system associated)